MLYYDEKLQELQKQMAQETRLTALRDSLARQRSELAPRVRALEEEKAKEQSDVDRLEGGSLSAFFYGVIGKKDEKLTKERQEAYAAAVKYDAAARELEAVESDLRRTEEQLRVLQGCAARYEQTLREKAKVIKTAGVPEAEEILRREERLGFLSGQLREIEEAETAGRAALSTAEDVLRSLDDAEGWGTLDLFGGGLLSDIAKYSSLDDAQEQVNRLQVQLRRFQTELADISVQADISIQVEGFLQFADLFFDGLFTDWMVLDRIGRSKSQARDTRDQLRQMLGRLTALRDETVSARDRTQQELDALILKTKV